MAIERSLDQLRALLDVDASSTGMLWDLVSVRLRAVHLFLSCGFAVATANLNVKSGTISALAIISANPGISQNELTQMSGTDRSTMVGVIDSLEEQGWAVREQSRTDRRRHALQVTPKGAKALKEIMASISAMETQMLAGFSEEDMAMFLDLLEKMQQSCKSFVRQA